MCGIAGIFAYHADAPRVEEQELLRVRDAMANRGPDGAGAWISADARRALAHRRLAIIGLAETGAQPMSTRDGRLQVTFNGEIYNYRDLRRHLEARGHRFFSDTDTEVLLYLYLEHGSEMVRHLRGMYAFAIIDESSQTLLLARDPFGIKPLYYADDGRTFRFASQVKALLKADAIDTTPSAAGHAGFYLWGHLPEPYTLYRGVKALPAGCTLLLGKRAPGEPQRFFDVAEELAAAERASAAQSQGETLAKLRCALQDSVKHHLVADVPVGVFLSSGLDSSTITALAAEARTGGLRTITLGFDEQAGTAQDETLDAARFAESYGTIHQTQWISHADFELEMSSVLEAMDQPSIDGINAYFISRAAARCGLKVALSGLGGDELFGGYPSFREIPRLVRALAPTRHLAGAGAGMRRLMAPLARKFTSPKYAGILEYGGSFEGAYLLRRALFMPWELPGIIGSRFARQGYEELRTLHALRHTMRGLASGHRRVCALELQWYMRNQLLRDADWAGMAHSLEIRVPLVDVSLFRAVASLGPLTKADMAAAPARALPRETLARPKAGFTVPVHTWLSRGANAGHAGRGVRGWARIVHPPRVREARALALVPEAYGGRGGIAQYNRDFLDALCEHPDVSEVVVLPRLMTDAAPSLPAKVRHETRGVGGKGRYLSALMRTTGNDKAFDLIVCAHINLLPLAQVVHRITGARVILLLYGIEAWQPPRSVLARRAASNVFAHVAISRITEERYCLWARPRGARGYVLPNAIHLACYGAGPKSAALAERYGIGGKRVLMTLGRLAGSERYKGFDEVLGLLPTLVRQVPDLVYLIAGEGDDRARLASRAQALGIADRVVFTGFVSEGDKAELYRLADVYVHPSSGEGFGFVTLEAMASGIPTIASRIDGGREALRDGELGILVDPRDASALESAILTALQRPKVIPPGLDYFSFANFRARLHRIVDDCLAGSNAFETAYARQPKPATCATRSHAHEPLRSARRI